MGLEDFWTAFCGQSICLKANTESCILHFETITSPSSCVNHASIVFCDALFLAMLISSILYKISAKSIGPPDRYRCYSTLQMSTAAFNCCLALVYIGLCVRSLAESFGEGRSLTPFHWWVLFLFQGFTYLSMGALSVRGQYIRKSPLLILSIFTFLAAGIFCFLALFAAITDRDLTTKVGLDVFSFIGACLLLLCTYKGLKYDSSKLYTPLNGESKLDSSVPTTQFSEAGLFSRMSFWWLNPLMELGGIRTLEEGDIPKLRQTDRAESCYLNFIEQSRKQSSVLWTILVCYKREILISGFFALLKTLTLSSGPLLLNSFIKVAEGEIAFRYEGYILAFLLFISKMIESYSQRQWYFQSQLAGLKVRSTLIALVYRKQQRISNVAKMSHSGGEIMNYVTVDAYRIGEFSIWFHQCWTTLLQLCIAIVILVQSVGLASSASLAVIILTVLCNTPLAKLQHKLQTKLMAAQDERLKATSEALTNMKVLKLYAWEAHFKKLIEKLREKEHHWLSGVQFRKAYNSLLFWTCPVVVSAATFGVCYWLEIPLHANNVFTFIATMRLVQDPIRIIPDVLGVFIQSRVALSRVVKFLEAPELQTEKVRKKSRFNEKTHGIVMKSANLSWDLISSRPALKNINLEVQPGQKIAICGEVGSGKSTLLAAILGEVPYIMGSVDVSGKIAYVPQTAWIQTGSIRENILFGSTMDDQRYQNTLRRCSLLKDLELLPYGDMTEIGERGINLSGGQKQRIQLARSLYQDADMYLLDDPFSALDAHTASSLFKEYVLEALSEKTVLLVTHQVDFLPAFHCCLLMSNGEILRAGSYHELLASSQEFLELVNAHKETAGTERLVEVNQHRRSNSLTKEILNVPRPQDESTTNNLIKLEEREMGDSGLKPYLLYLKQNKGYLYLTIAILAQVLFATDLALQNAWMASGVDNPHVTTYKLIVVYLIIGSCSLLFLLIRALSTVTLGLESSKSLFSKLLNSLFRAPMPFYDCTPLGRIFSRVSSDLSIVDLDVPFSFLYVLGATGSTYATLAVLVVVTWQVLFVCVPVMYLATRLQRYYFATAKELMRLNGTTKSLVAGHLTESVAGAMTIRAFEEQDRFFSKNLELIDRNASPFFHNFAANEWLIQRVETLSATILVAAALFMVVLPPGTFSSGFIGMAISYGLTLNTGMLYYIQNQSTLANHIISVERLNQYMHIPSEAPEVIEDNRPSKYWPSVGKVEICDLKIRYRPDTPLVLRGISCTFEGGDKIGIVGRTGSGKTTLIGALFRLVEPAAGTIVVDGVDICSIGLHDLRSRFGIIPQDPTLFNGTVRFNLDPLSQHTDEDIWEVLGKCQLKEVVQAKEQGLDSLVAEDGSNWSMGQRQLFCLGRALLRRSRVLVLDEATASIDNATDMILQKTIRTEFSDCTVLTVAHRIPTVMDCTKVLAISDGLLVEYDEPMKLMKKEGSLFGQLVKEYWSHIHSAQSH